MKAIAAIIVIAAILYALRWAVKTILELTDSISAAEKFKKYNRNEPE